MQKKHSRLFFFSPHRLMQSQIETRTFEGSQDGKRHVVATALLTLGVHA